MLSLGTLGMALNLRGASRRKVLSTMRGLGELESAVMTALWSSTEPMRVRDVMDVMDPARPFAYTTVMTVLDNLHGKNWVTRERVGRAYHYRPRLSKTAAIAETVRGILDESDESEAILLHFAQSTSDDESDALRRGLRRRARRT